MVLIANPQGNFPLNDDWNYARSVKSLLEEQKLLMTQWSLAASLTQIAIGTVVCSIFGFSFDALRLSTIVLGFVAIAVTYFLCRRLCKNYALSAFLALLLASNPLFFNLALTFMTDVPFLAIAGLTLLAFFRLLETDANKRTAGALSIAFATLCATAACLLRQTGLVLPIAFACTYLCQTKKLEAPKNWLSSIAIALLPAVVSLISIFFFQSWLEKSVGTLYSYQAEKAYMEQRFSQGFVFMSGEFGRNLIKVLLYLGIAFLPVLPLTFKRYASVLSKRERLFQLGLGIELAILLALGLLVSGASMPLADNVFYNIGLGPLLLGLDPKESTQGWPMAPPYVMQAITVAACLGAGYLCAVFLTLFTRCLKKKESLGSGAAHYPTILCIATLCAYLLIICIRGFFDRYLLFPMFLFIPLLASSFELKSEVEGASNGLLQEKHSGDNSWRGVPAPNRALAFLLLLPLQYFAIAGTHDYLEWNRSRWQAANEFLKDPDHSAMDIDGGLEFNGWYAYDPKYKGKDSVVLDTSMRHGDKYAITVSEVKGYNVLKRYVFQRWLPPGQGEILLLQKQ